MAMNDFVRRSMQIVAGGIAQSTTDYFDNAISFANDVKEVIDMGKQMGSDGAKKFNELRNSGILKKTRDWFYNEGGMFGDFDFDDDDFDAGFEIDSADSESKGDKSQPLSKDMMTDIAKKQTGAMYKAFGRQADLQIANTAEIISTINTRTAELTASVNNVNNTLIQIGKRLDLIVEWTSARTKKEEEQLKKASILDYGGGISLSGLVAKGKEQAEDSMFGTMLSIGKTMLGSGMMTPEMLLSTILSQTVLDKKFDKLGGKSVNDIGEFINDTVGEAIQNSLTKILKTKKEPFANIFEDLLSRGGKRNYQNSVANQYNDKPAVFDAMTRKSIITIIPGYLNEILKAVSGGQGMNVDNKGNLKSGTGANSFVKAVSENYFKSGTMDWKQRERASEGTGLTTTEVSNAVRTLTGSWIWSMYAYDIVVLDVGQIKDMSNPVTKEVINDAAKAMASVDPKHRSVEKWISLYKGIIYEIDEFKYRQELQRSAERADKNLEDFAKHHVNNHQAGKVDTSVWMAAFKDMYKEYNGSSTTTTTTTTPGTVSPSPIGGTTSPLSITELDYMAGVFDRLNRGINVFVTGQAKNRSTQYKKIRMIPGYAKRAMSSAGTSSSDDPDRPEGGSTIPGPAGKIVEKVFKPKDSALRKAAAETSPELAEAIDRVAAGEGTPEDKAAVEEFKKEYNKPTNFIKRAGGAIKKGWNKFADNSRKEGIIADPAGYAMVDDFVEKTKGWFSDILPERAKNAAEKVKSNETYQKVTGNEHVQNAKNNVNKATNKVVDLFAGKRSVDANGELVRTGGLLHGIVSKGNNAGIALRAKTNSNEKLIEKSRNVLNDYSPDKHFDESEKDALQMQLISSELNVAMSNGDFSNVDEQTVMKAFNKIESADLKSQLRQSVLPLLKKNGRTIDESKAGSGSEGKSTLRKIGSLLWGAAKLAIAPIVSYVKLVIGSVFLIIKKGAGVILKFAMKGIKRGLTNIKAGFKSVGKGIVHMFKPLVGPAKAFVNVAYKAATFLKDKATKLIKTAGTYIKKFGKSAMSFVKTVKKGIKSGLSKAFGGIAKTIATPFIKIGGAIAGKLGGLFKKKDQTPQMENIDSRTGVKGMLSKIGDKFANTSFGKGFMKARNERKEAQAKAKLEEEAKPVTEGIEKSELGKGLKDLFDNENGKGFFKKLITLVQGIFDKTPDKSEEGAGGMEDAEGSSSTDLGGEKTESEGESPQMADINDTSSSGSSGGGSKQKSGPQMEDVGPIPSGGGGGGADAGGGAGGKLGKIAGAVKGGISDMLGGIGEMLGGLSGIMGGILQVVLSVVMALEGLKALQELVMGILKESLMPLNEAFQALMKAFKPVLKQLGGIIKQLAEFIVVIVDAVMDVIKPILTDVVQPILEVLSPLLQSIIGCLTPLLQLVGIILKLVLVPLMGVIKYVLLPIIKIIGDAVQIIMGVLQIGFGLIMGAIGVVISVLGKVISCIPGAGGKGKDIAKSGGEMATQGKTFVSEGLKSVKQGVMNYVSDMASMLTLGLVGGDEDEDSDKKETKQIEAADGNQVETTFANGDVTNNYYNGSSDIYNTYGGEYQRGMGGYLNMDQRGCGPIALADMYNRNNSGRVSARSLAGMMNNSGAYDPRRGTSVGDYIDTARGMGMNVHAGKVTQQSLKSASPTHPITVVGSGSDYGTRKGNNHFMNVVGTDSHGGAYVSNPLTGRIDRKPASTVAGSAVMGIYGSGDEADGGYSFPDAIKEAFAKLKEEANKILGLFSMEKSEEEKAQDLIDAEKNQGAMEQAKKTLGEEKYAKYEEEAKALAREQFEKDNPKKDGQSDEEYEAAFEKYWSKNSTSFLAKTSLMEDAQSENKDAMMTLATATEEFTDKYNEKFEESAKYANEGHEGSGSGGGSGYFSSNEGVEMWTPYGDNIQITETDITKGPANAPLFEFFAKTMGLQLGDIYGSGWFSHYNNPNKEGVGSGGDSHSGVDFTGGDILGKPLYATTGGKVIANWSPGESGGGGNTVIWQDSAGKLHWYMHMNEQSELKVGDEIEGGDLIGYAGNTGLSTGPHLHYTINDTTSSSGGGNVYNPLMYFSNYNPSGGAGVALGDTDEEKIYSYLTTAGMTPIGASGLMGCFKYESDMKTNNLENSFNDMFGMSDSEYTSAVDSGKETEQQFLTGRNMVAFSGQTPGEAMGYGIAQFTSSGLKKDLYDKTVKKGKSIASLEPQLDAIISVLKDRGIYDTINNAATPTDANKTFLWKYEAGTGYTSDAAVLKAYPWMTTSNPDGTVLRHQYAEQVYNTYKDWKPQKATNGFTDSNGTVHINSAGDEKMYKNLKQTGSTSGKGTGVVITKEGQLNVRKDKSINSDIIGQLNSGDQIEIEACNSTDWLYVPSLGGYVSADFVNVITSDNQNEDWGVQKYTGPINSAADARMATEGYGNGTQAYTISGYTGSGSTTVNSNHDGDAQWYKTDAGNWKFDERVFAKDDPRWRAAWYDESSPQHYDEARSAYDALAHMVIVGNNPNIREGKYYNNLVKAYGGGSQGKDAVQSLYDDVGNWQEWKSSRDKYIKKKKKDRLNAQFTEDLWYLHNAYWPNNKLSLGDINTRIKGSGDMDEMDFWDSYLGWNNKYANSNITTPVGEDQIDVSSDAYYDEATGTTVVNTYNVTRGEDKATEARLKAILANTYNVRSESMEALLEAILEELKRRKDGKPGPTNTSGSSKLFDERIPSQVTKLSVG